MWDPLDPYGLKDPFRTLNAGPTMLTMPVPNSTGSSGINSGSSEDPYPGVQDGLLLATYSPNQGSQAFTAGDLVPFVGEGDASHDIGSASVTLDFAVPGVWQSDGGAELVGAAIGAGAAVASLAVDNFFVPDPANIPIGQELSLDTSSPFIPPQAPSGAPYTPPAAGAPLPPIVLPPMRPEVPQSALPVTDATPSVATPSTPEQDWTTQTFLTYPYADWNFIHPVSAFDTGNRALNVLFNVEISARNFIAFWEGALPETLSLLDDALRHSAIKVEYQNSQDILPMMKTWGLAMESGPALNYLFTSISQSNRLKPVVRASVFMLLGAVGEGGSAAEELSSPVLNTHLADSVARSRSYKDPARGGVLSFRQWLAQTQGAPRFSRVAPGNKMPWWLARGQAFHDAVYKWFGIPENSRSIFGAVGNGSHYHSIPDILNAGIVADVKDVVDIGWTRQLRAQHEVAESSNVPFSLIVSPNNESIDQRVIDAVNSTKGLIIRFDEQLGRVTEYLDLPSNTWLSY